MPTYTKRGRVLLQDTGSNDGTWGEEDTVGTSTRQDDMWGTAEVVVAAPVTLTALEAFTDEARSVTIICTGAGGFPVSTPSAVDKPYLVINNCAADITFGPTGGTYATVRAGTRVVVAINAAGTVAYAFDPTLDQIKTAAGDVDFGDNKALNLADPTDDQDAATKIYVDTFTANRSAGGYKLTNLADAVLGSNDAPPISQVEELINGVVVGLPIQTGSASKFLKTNGTLASWDKVTLSDTGEVEGTLPVGNGGTGLSTIGANQLLLGNGASPIALLASGSATQVLVSNGPGSAPSFQTINTSGLGIGQSWQTATRALATSYQNLTGKPIEVATYSVGSPNIELQVSSDNSTWFTVGWLVSSLASTTAVVPNNHYYRWTGTGTFVARELR